MAKYNVFARRSSTEDWSIWTSTNSARTALRAIKVIMSYGYQWNMQKPMTRTSFITKCYAVQISPARAKSFAKGRIHFTQHDVDYLLKEEQEHGEEK